MIKIFRKLKKSFDSYSVKSKLLVIIMSVTVICTVFALLSFTYLSVVNIKEQMKSNISATGQIIASRVNAALMFDDNSAAFETLSSLSLNKSIQQACIYDGKGEVFARYNSGDMVAANCPDIEVSAVYFADEMLRFFSPITDQFNNESIGNLYIQSDLQPIYSYLTKQAIVGLSVIFIVLLLAYSLSLKLQKIISKPLNYLLDRGVEENNFFTPSQEFHDGNEFSKIDMLMRAVMTRISYLEQQNARARKSYEDLVKNSESTLSYLADELKQPVEATIAFADILSSRAIGPVDEEYVSYYNDVYFTVFYYYGIINDSMKLFHDHLDPENSKRQLTDLALLVHDALVNVKDDKPEFLEGFKFSSEYDISPDIKKIVIDKIVIRELIYNSVFVYTKYLAFLGKDEIHLKVKAVIDDEDSDAKKFKLIISCRELENESVAEFLENHRKYQNDVHMLRSKLQFMKFLAKYDGGHLDFGEDLREMDQMIILFPLSKVDDSNIYLKQNANFNLEDLFKDKVNI